MRSLNTSALMVLLGLQGTVARAEEASPRDEARAHFKTGLALARAGELEGALEAFQRAYDTSPNYAVLYNLGRAYQALGRSPEAVATLERFLTEGGENIPAARRNEVEALVARERARLCQAEIEVTPPEAEVFLDGRRLGTSPVPAQDLLPGEHVIMARMPGRMPRLEVIALEAGDVQRVSLILEPEPPPPAAPVAVPTPASETKPAELRAAHLPPESSAHHGWALGLGIGGIALASAAIATFAWNNNRYEAWQRDRQAFEAALGAGAPPETTSIQITNLRSRAVNIQRVDDLALGMAIAAGGALVTAGVLWLTAPKHHRSSAAAAPPP